MAKIEFNGKSGMGPLQLMPGANHYRLLGLEITRAGNGASIHNLVAPKEDSNAHHIIYDRLWVHGNAQDETKGGVHLSGTTYMAVVDSYFSDLHCTSIKGACTDAQAINGGGGNVSRRPLQDREQFS